MKIIKQFFFSLLLLGSFFNSNAAHAGIPVIDAANLANSIQQVLAWGQQYQQMASQIQQMQQQISAVTGSRGLGNIINNQTLQQIVPSDITTIYSSINSGGFNNLTNTAQSIRSANMIYNCEDRTGESKSTCESVLNSNAQTQAFQQTALQLTTQRVSQIQSLQDQIDATQDAKAIAELQARIQAENTQVSNDANRLAMMKAIAETQQQAAEQAIKERTLKMLARDTPPAANSFVYQPPQ